MHGGLIIWNNEDDDDNNSDLDDLQDYEDLYWSYSWQWRI